MIQDVILAGRKEGMLSWVDLETGMICPATLITVPVHVVTQIKAESRLQVGLDEGVKSHRLNKPQLGQCRAAKVITRRLHETASPAGQDWSVGDRFNVSLVESGSYVDIAGTTKGKGFQGGVKRHGFRTQDATHGNSVSHRAIGSTGQCQDPGKVFRGKKMPGQMGSTRQTQFNIAVLHVDSENNALIVKGSVPGANGGYVRIKKTVKGRKKQ